MIKERFIKFNLGAVLLGEEAKKADGGSLELAAAADNLDDAGGLGFSVGVGIGIGLTLLFGIILGVFVCKFRKS